MMDTHELEKILNEALDEFSKNISSSYAEGSKEPATEGDISELAHQTYYSLREFKRAIIEYLSDK